MPIDHNEDRFEDQICEILSLSGYLLRLKKDLDKEIVLDKGMHLQFIKDTQNEALLKIGEIYGSNTNEKYFQKLDEEIDKRGVDICSEERFLHLRYSF